MFRRGREWHAQFEALLRLTRRDEVLYEGEIEPGHKVDLPDGMRLEVLWIRKHHEPDAKS